MQNEDPDHNNFSKKLVFPFSLWLNSFRQKLAEGGSLLLLLNSNEFNESDHFLSPDNEFALWFGFISSKRGTEEIFKSQTEVMGEQTCLGRRSMNKINVINSGCDWLQRL